MLFLVQIEKREGVTKISNDFFFFFKGVGEESNKKK